MATSLHTWYWHRVRVVGSLVLPLLVPLGHTACAAEPLRLAGPALIAPGQGQPPALALGSAGVEGTSSATAQPAGHPYTLAECIQVALQQQPAMNAARASLAAAETGRRALDNLRVPLGFLLAPDLPTRRCQASLGVTIAAAALD